MWGPHKFFACSSLPTVGLVAGMNTVALGMSYAIVTHGGWWAFGSRVQMHLSPSLMPSLLILVNFGVAGTQGCSTFRCPFMVPVVGDAGR